MGDEYWSIDIPDLTEEQAGMLQGRLEPDFEVIRIDPRQFMVRAFDRRSVEFLVGQLQASVAAGVLDPTDDYGARALLADFQEWLAQADPAP